MRFYRFLPALILNLSLQTGFAEQGQIPNIVIILADDLGWGDLSCFGARRIRTPELDRMAAEGVRFTDFYVPAPVCSPSRAALLTGNYPFRSRIDRVLHPGYRSGLSRTEITLPGVLQERGYATALIGKWHLGSQMPFLPLQHGFDEYFGIPYSNDMRPLLFMEGNAFVTDEIPIQAHLTRRFTDRAIIFMERHRSQPFFLLLSHAMPHYPIAVAGEWAGSSREGVYGDVIQELDWSVGKILRTLEDLGLDQKTVVFFTSDNGPWRPRSSGGLRGAKSSTWEGGIRVPLIARFPGIFNTGSVVSEPAMIFDLFRTSLDLAGIDAPSSAATDSRSLLSWLLKEPRDTTSGPGREGEPLFFFNRGNLHAVRLGPWKLHLARRSFLRKSHTIPLELFDLVRDPGETSNLASIHPEWVARLESAIEEFIQKNPALAPRVQVSKGTNQTSR